ncbi:hypothetical protein BWI17_18730 [Betaproteobacteria bacterium GR16-43]|nr:hypothetical protein BWI17_18730 [Betaproteobacteria bacterium GR16-43]
MITANPTTIAAVVLVPLLAWRIYRRVRRTIGRQRLSKIRPWLTVAFFPLLVVVLGLVSASHPERLLWLAGGLAAGAWLGAYGLRKTAFEATDEGLYYTPHAPLGIAISVLFVGRILYRFYEIYALAPGRVDDFARSPLTLAIFGVLAAYYTVYVGGLLRWRFRVAREAVASA